ncbi:MAG: hypothetical protein L0227_00385 [Chloroflexi bacterium]|nr:hypothetical protein [Chloroflexota bacterium]
MPITIAILVVALVAMACGGSSGPGVASLESQDPGSGAASPSPSVDPQEAALAFAECMREHGVDMADPEFDSAGGGGFRIGIGSPNGGDVPDRETLEAAMEACRELMPTLGGPGGRELTPEDQDKILAFTECMREHGVDMPDPQFGEGGGFIRVGPGDDANGDGPAFDPSDEDFQAAQEACRELLPGFGLDSGSATTDGDGPSTDTKLP